MVLSPSRGLHTDHPLQFNHEWGGLPWEPEMKATIARFDPMNYVTNWSRGSKDYRLPDTGDLYNAALVSRDWALAARRPLYNHISYNTKFPSAPLFFSAWQQMWLDNFDAFFLHAPFVSNSRQMRWRGEWLAYEHFTTCLILSRIQRLGVCLLISPRDFDATPPSPTLRQLDLHMLLSAAGSIPFRLYSDPPEDHEVPD
ncbi:hypothetical protein CERSUDRAFT_121804 [Gelatoporia subvermispora B]|uniref:Uncharacterized protein n=1 Tax=Ceriporiopsis subvermispora (strain B) TaxID=914234 RepID=M2RL68_CERS8|nr:hypothetical protein CERSUDRAFT_121804 [Gelatoporia subvermispora B]